MGLFVLLDTKVGIVQGWDDSLAVHLSATRWALSQSTPSEKQGTLPHETVRAEYLCLEGGPAVELHSQATDRAKDKQPTLTHETLRAEWR